MLGEENGTKYEFYKRVKEEIVKRKPPPLAVLHQL